MAELYDPFADDEEPPDHRCRYYTAVICVNGHVLRSYQCPECPYWQDYCSECGAPAHSQCLNCQRPFAGHYRVTDERGYNRPNHCYYCGVAHPWRQRELHAACDLADILDGLKPADRERLKASLEDLLSDTPRTGVAVTFFKQLSRKVGEEGAPILRKLATDLFCETAKKLLLPS
jgi:hypothetical protein